MSAWTLRFDGFETAEEGLREALCTLGNGYFATRGAAPEAEADEVHYPGTYLAGGYNRLTTHISGRDVENEDLVNLPNWLPLRIRAADDVWLNFQAHEVRHYRLELDMRAGLLRREVVLCDRHGRVTRLESRRLVSMADRHVAAMETVITAENWSGDAGDRIGHSSRRDQRRRRPLPGAEREPPADRGGGRPRSAACSPTCAPVSRASRWHRPRGPACMPTQGPWT